MKIFLLVFILLGSCSFKKNNQKLQGHEELYSAPAAPELAPLKAEEKRIVIAATNDLHGSYAPEAIDFQDEHNEQKQRVTLGGEEVIARYFDILRQTYKHVVLVDSGDIFSSQSDIDSVADFYSKNKYDALTVGLRDFNLKIPFRFKNNTQLFKSFAKKSKVPLVLSNLYELKTARGVEWKGTQSHIIKELGGVKVGIIGLIPDDLVEQTPINNRVGLFVENMLQSTLRHSRILRSLGADIIVVLTHQGIECGNEMAEEMKIPLKKVNFDPYREKICNLNSPLGEYLQRLPPELVDVVIGGRIPQKIVNVINGTLVLGGFHDGKGMSYVELVVNTKLNKLVPEKTQIHQPILFCQEFFKETKDCYWEDKTIDHSKRVPATFLGLPIDPSNSSIKAEVERKSSDRSVSLQSIELFKADLIFSPQSTGDTQLVVLKLMGDELIKVLEEDFNSGKKSDWIPSPFTVLADELVVELSGKKIMPQKEYRVLTDLESLQKHRALLKKMRELEFEVFANHSWNSSQDSVSSTLAAQAR